MVDVVRITEANAPVAVRVTEPGSPAVVRTVEIGPMGPQGVGGDGVVISATEPDVDPGQSVLWIQTGLGPDGLGVTLYLKTEPA